MTRIIPIPKCYVGYALWIILFSFNAYTLYWFVCLWPTIDHQSIELGLFMLWFVVGGIFGTICNAVFTGFAIHDLNRRHHFIRWYGIGFKLVPCSEPSVLFNHEHEWDFGTIVDNKVICKHFKCHEKRTLTPAEIEEYSRK